MAFRTLPVGLSLLFGLVTATDYYASPDPKGTDKSLEDCLGMLSKNDRCLLRSGHYYPAGVTELAKSKAKPLENVVVAPAEDGGEVVIDGTSELKDLEWKTCANEDASLSCAEGVYVARLGGAKFSQLFFGGEDVDDREMLVNARWPNAYAIPAEAVDAPVWAGIFDSKTAWSFPDGSKSGRVANKADKVDTSNRVAADYAKFVDAGGTTVEEEVEVEDDEFETVTRSSPAGFLKDAGISVKGANIIITYGKGSVEEGVVTEHDAGSNNFEFRHPQCQSGGYGSCGKGFWKDAFNSYFFENALGLLDQEKEFYFELNAKVGNRLFLKAPNGKKPSFRLWARHSDYFLTVDGSKQFTVQGIKTFATTFTTPGGQPNPGFRLLDSVFVYPTCGKRLLGDYLGKHVMYFHNADGALFSNNIWRYAEGTALDAKGEQMTMEDNLFEYNGIYSTSGPQTIKWAGPGGRVAHNTLRWNGQVTGWKLMGAGQVVEMNHIEHQSWGQLLHDGAGLHVQMSAGDSEYAYNWVHDGHHSLGIRFDTAKTSVFNVPEDVGHDGQVHNNVLWGKSIKLAMKGERHNVTQNTVVGGAKLMLVRAFGVQQGMNEMTLCDKNAMESAPAPRGKQWLGRRRSPNAPGKWKNTPDDEKKETRPKGDVWVTPPKVKDNEVDKDLCWDSLRDCKHRDFRPTDGSALDGAGAYAQDAQRYWVPGRRTETPEAAVPLNGATDVSFEAAALIFKPAKGCDSYKLVLTDSGGDALEEELTDGRNVWDVGALEKGETYEWAVTPMAAAAGCENAKSASFTFTAATEKRTTTTTPPPETCFDQREVRKGVIGAAWCEKMSAKCERSLVIKECEKTCGICAPATTTTTTTATIAASTTPEGASTCTDQKERAWCEQMQAKGNCKRNNVKKGCQKTCGECTLLLQRNGDAAPEQAKEEDLPVMSTARARKFLARAVTKGASLVQQSGELFRSTFFTLEEEPDGESMEL